MTELKRKIKGSKTEYVLLAGALLDVIIFALLDLTVSRGMNASDLFDFGIFSKMDINCGGYIVSYLISITVSLAFIFIALRQDRQAKKSAGLFYLFVSLLTVVVLTYFGSSIGTVLLSHYWNTSFINVIVKMMLTVFSFLWLYPTVKFTLSAKKPPKIKGGKQCY